MFHLLAPLPLFLSPPSKLCSLCLWVAVLFGLRSVDWFVESINTRDESVIKFFRSCCHAGTASYVRCTWCCQGPLFFEHTVRQYYYWFTFHSIMTLHWTVQYYVIHIVQHQNYLCASTGVQPLSTNQHHHDTVLQYTHWLHYSTCAVPLHDMYCT